MRPIPSEAIPAFLTQPDRASRPLRLPLTPAVVALCSLALAAAGSSLFTAGLLTGIGLGLDAAVTVQGTIPAPLQPATRLLPRPLPVPETRAVTPELQTRFPATRSHGAGQPGIGNSLTVHDTPRIAEADSRAVLLPVIPVAKPAAPPRPHPSPQAASWTVQTGAFRNVNNARQMGQRLALLGLTAHTTLTRSGLTVVHINGLSSQSDARALTRRLAQENIPALVRYGP